MYTTNTGGGWNNDINWGNWESGYGTTQYGTSPKMIEAIEEIKQYLLREFPHVCSEKVTDSTGDDSTPNLLNEVANNVMDFLVSEHVEKHFCDKNPDPNLKEDITSKLGILRPRFEHLLRRPLTEDQRQKFLDAVLQYMSDNPDSESDFDVSIEKFSLNNPERFYKHIIFRLLPHSPSGAMTSKRGKIAKGRFLLSQNKNLKSFHVRGKEYSYDGICTVITHPRIEEHNKQKKYTGYYRRSEYMFEFVSNDNKHVKKCLPLRPDFTFTFIDLGGGYCVSTNPYFVNDLLLLLYFEGKVVQMVDFEYIENLGNGFIRGLYYDRVNGRRANRWYRNAEDEKAERKKEEEEEEIKGRAFSTRLFFRGEDVDHYEYGGEQGHTRLSDQVFIKGRTVPESPFRSYGDFLCKDDLVRYHKNATVIMSTKSCWTRGDMKSSDVEIHRITKNGRLIFSSKEEGEEMYTKPLIIRSKMTQEKNDKIIVMEKREDKLILNLYNQKTCRSIAKGLCFVGNLGYLKTLSQCMRNMSERIFFYDTLTYPKTQFKKFSSPYQKFIVNLHCMNCDSSSEFSKIPKDVLSHGIIPFLSEIEIIINPIRHVKKIVKILNLSNLENQGYSDFHPSGSDSFEPVFNNFPLKPKHFTSLSDISKPFAMWRAMDLIRRHTYSDFDMIRREMKFVSTQTTRLLSPEEIAEQERRKKLRIRKLKKLGRPTSELNQEAVRTLEETDFFDFGGGGEDNNNNIRIPEIMNVLFREIEVDDYIHRNLRKEVFRLLLRTWSNMQKMIEILSCNIYRKFWIW